MAYKNMKQPFSFADLALESSVKNNRSIELMKQIKKSINWKRVETILLSHYEAGKSDEGANAYPPILLYKCLLLQKWFHIKSDPELENQINDRLSFKEFLDLSFSFPSPDHSTFSRFRGRLSKKALEELNSEILQQFEAKGLIINEGIAVDARLVKSASHPISKEQIEKLREERKTPEGNLDKNGNPKKFSRDSESDWVIKNDKPHYGLKEHSSVDVNNGFVLATALSAASVNDTNYLQYCTLFSYHTKQPIEVVYADKGYAGKPNREFLTLNNIKDGIMRKASKSSPLTHYEKERNKKISKVRYIVEQYFGLSHLHDGAQRARFTKIAKNNLDCWIRQAAFNISRGLKILNLATV